MRNRRKARGIGIAARMVVAELPAGWHCLMVTLTYREGEKWAARQVTAYRERVRKWAERHGAKPKIITSLEPSENGRTLPHYHVLIWLPRRLLLPKADKRGWWVHGLSNTTPVKSAVGYVSKYVAKATGATLPHRARSFSVSGLCGDARVHRAFLMLPGYVREIFAPEDRVSRAVGGGWLSKRTGEVIPARWRLVDRAKDWSWMEFAERTTIPNA